MPLQKCILNLHVYMYFQRQENLSVEERERPDVRRPVASDSAVKLESNCSEQLHSVNERKSLTKQMKTLCFGKLL